MRKRPAFLCVVLAFALACSTPACERIAPYVKGQIKILYIPSVAMAKRIAATIVLPEGYAQKENKNKKYPVIILLHGYSGDFKQWQTIADLPRLASRYETILVCPDGGYDSWYFDSPVDAGSQYESFIMRDVIAFVDTTYRTLGARGRAITGLSMGGHGAVRLISVYPDSFVAAGSMSGILDLRVFPVSWNIAGRLGSMQEHPQRWAMGSAVNLVKNLQGKGKCLIIDCGTNDFALAVNHAYRDSAAVHGVAITYEESEGGHDHAYWAKRIEPHIRFLQACFPGRK